MVPLKPMYVAKPSGVSARSFIVCAALVSLTMALASRTFHLSSSFTAVAQSSSHNEKIQQLADDAHHWSAPAAGFSILLPLMLPVKIAVEQEPLFAVHWDGCLYNRPPPPADGMSGFVQ